jgi:hypothetical protein
MFQYLNSVPAPEQDAGLLVFGRKDPLVAQTAGRAVMDGIGTFIVITGGVGKDSGDLKVPEAVYLEGILADAYPNIAVPVYTETKATNGGENVRFGLGLMDKEGLPYQRALNTVAHATSARRLTETTRHEAIQRGTPVGYLGGIATAYAFNPENPTDQKESVDELLRLANWPAKGWLQPQVDLPLDLVDFATDIAAQHH